jgi:hypothetical protein
VDPGGDDDAGRRPAAAPEALPCRSITVGHRQHGAQHAPAPRWLVIVRTPPTKQIGEKLSLSPRTVSTHLYRIFPKRRVTSRAGLRDAITGSAQT